MKNLAFTNFRFKNYNVRSANGLNSNMHSHLTYFEFMFQNVKTRLIVPTPL